MTAYTLEEALVEEFKVRLKGLISMQEDYLLSGGAEDQATYKYHVGYRRGLTEAQDIFSDLLKQFFPR